MEKDPNELINRIENNEDLLENKYALIVVGRMGHGKSSFCKMVVDDSEKYKIQAHVSIKSALPNWRLLINTIRSLKLPKSNRTGNLFTKQNLK